MIPFYDNQVYHNIPQQQQQQHYLQQQQQQQQSYQSKMDKTEYSFSKLSLNNQPSQQQQQTSPTPANNNSSGITTTTNSSGGSTGGGGIGFNASSLNNNNPLLLNSRILPVYSQHHHQISMSSSYVSGDSDSNYDDERLLDEQSHQLQKSLDLLSDSDESVPFSMSNIYFNASNQSIGNISNSSINTSGGIYGQHVVGNNNYPPLIGQQQQKKLSPTFSSGGGQQAQYQQQHLYHQQQQHPHYQQQINHMIQQPLHHQPPPPPPLPQQQQQQQQQKSFGPVGVSWMDGPIMAPQSSQSTFKSYDLPNDFLQQPHHHGGPSQQSYYQPPPHHHPHSHYQGGGFGVTSSPDFSSPTYFGQQQQQQQPQSHLQGLNGFISKPPPLLQQQQQQSMMKQTSPLMNGSGLDWSSSYQKPPQPQPQPTSHLSGFYQSSPIFGGYSHSPISSPQELLVGTSLPQKSMGPIHSQSIQPPPVVSLQSPPTQTTPPLGTNASQQQTSTDTKTKPFNPLVAPFLPTSNKGSSFHQQQPPPQQQQRYNESSGKSSHHQQQVHHHHNQPQQHGQHSVNQHQQQHHQSSHHHHHNQQQQHQSSHHHHGHHNNQQHSNQYYGHSSHHHHHHPNQSYQPQPQQQQPQQQQRERSSSLTSGKHNISNPNINNNNNSQQSIDQLSFDYKSYEQVDPELDHYNKGGDITATSSGAAAGSGSSGTTTTTTGTNKQIELKRGEMVESPISRQQYKHFIKQFKLKEKEGLQVAMEFAKESLKTLSEKVHWRVYLELADLANRQNNLKLARKFYRIVTRTQPYISQGWLEYAKMEEDYGRLEKCQQILQLGLKYCPFNESLLIKGIRHEEKMDNLEGARALLSQLRDQSIFKTWRAVMEGGLLEARAGNIDVARKIFKYLMKHVPWYGPIYQEAYKLEERCEDYDRAIAIVEKGLSEDPKYGPLWFSALRLYEKTSNGHLQHTRATVDRARQSVSREVTWKVYFEAAQIEERANHLALARAAYVKSVELCPENLLWKVWLGGSRTELNADNINVARKLVFRALKEVPAKLKSLVLLEYSRLEEYAGNINKSRRILKMAHDEARLDWKVFLESVLLEMRANNYEDATNAAKESLKIHSGAGRLWAALIQLNQLKGYQAQLKVFKKALQFVPKSGEVWCEGARIALNNNDLEKAKRFLEFAVQFTPQFGDSFIELLRLEIMEKGFNCDTSRLEQLCINADPNYGFMWLHCTNSVLDSPRQVLRNAKKLLIETTPATREDYEKTKDVRYGSCWVGSIGVLSTNRLFRNDFNKMTNEERRKCMFGSDLVKP